MRVCWRMVPPGAPDVYQKFLPPLAPGAHSWLLSGHLGWLRFPSGGGVHDGKFGQKIFFHYPPPSPFTSNLKARPWLSLWSREDKDVGPSGLTPRAQLSITASPPLSPFTPGSWTHGCQPGNNPQTMEAWKPGLDTLLATYLLLLAAVEA